MAQASDPGTAFDDAARLRRGMADIVALASLPAAWASAARAQIARDLAETLRHILPATLVLVALKRSGDHEPVNALSTDGSYDADTCNRLVQSLAAAAADAASSPGQPPQLALPDPSSISAIGIYGEHGLLAVTSMQRSFPGDTDRVVLNIAANMAAYALQARQTADERERAEDALRRATDEQRITDLLQRIGTVVAAELDTERLLQSVTDETTALAGADFGAFFYNVTNDAGESYMLYTLSGAPRDAFARFPMPRNTAIFAPTFNGEGVVRLDDVSADPRYGHNPPHHGMPAGHLPVRSYLAVPVRSRTGVVHGGLFFGHRAVAMFTERHERLVVGVAAWAALAIDNANLYRQAQQANKAKDHFLAMLSHELRTPLNAIMGWVSMLERADEMGPATLSKGYHAVARNTHLLSQLVEDLLDVSRIAAGKLQLIIGDVDLNDVVRESVRLAQPAADEKSLALRMVLPGVCRVRGDVTRLGQAVSNLVTNAVKFTSPGGTITVSLQSDDEQATIAVADTGIGIHPDFLPVVFDPFRQASSIPGSHGLGLGLAIVRNLIVLHGGTVSAHSDGVGRGARFTITLPRTSSSSHSQAG
jgi:signal transduction histidine kinase